MFGQPCSSLGRRYEESDRLKCLSISRERSDNAMLLSVILKLLVTRLFPLARDFVELIDERVGNASLFNRVP